MPGIVPLGLVPSLVPMPCWQTRSLEAAQGHMAGVFADHRLESCSREIAFEHRTLGTGRLSLHSLRYGAEVVVGAPALERFYLLQLTLAGACEVSLGRRSSTVREGELLVVNPTRPYRKRWSAGCTQLIVRLDRELVEQAWCDRHGPETSRSIEFAFDKAPAVSAWHLRRALNAAVELIAEDSRCRAARIIADALVEALPPAVADSGGPAPLQLVRRAEAFMDSFLSQDLAIHQVAQATGVTTRSLERAFRQVRQATVVACLRRMRLERARRELRSAANDERTVTQVATSLGLLHAGRFSVAYRSRFGEAPSETLRGARRRSPCPARNPRV